MCLLQAQLREKKPRRARAKAAKSRSSKKRRAKSAAAAASPRPGKARSGGTKLCRSHEETSCAGTTITGIDHNTHCISRHGVVLVNSQRLCLPGSRTQCVRMQSTRSVADELGPSRLGRRNQTPVLGCAEGSARDMVPRGPVEEGAR